MSRYIDADELVKRLNACKYPAPKTTNRQAAYNTAISDACRSIDAMPAADVVEVRHGKWDGDACSMCWFSWCDVTYDVPQMQMPYCPNCGAKMNLAEDE